jgi:hypothetical protein
MTRTMSRAGPVVVGSRDNEVKAEVEVEEVIWVNKWIFDAGVSVSRRQWCGLSS